MTRSMLQTGQPFPGINSYKKDLAKDTDGLIEIYFSPKAPAGSSAGLGAGKQTNRVQTAPGKGWMIILRLYGPLEPWFDKTWRPGEIEKVE